jgi:hypothetical protein
MPIDATSRATSPAGNVGSQENAALDDALKDTFPASDPVAMLEPSGAAPERPVVAPQVEARGGVTGNNVRYVLGYGLAGVVIAFIVIYFIYNH